MANKPMSNEMPAWGKPLLLELNPNNIYGDVPFELPLYTSEAVVAHVLRGELPDNDPNYPLWRDGFEQDLASQGGLLGLGVSFGPTSAITKLDGYGLGAAKTAAKKPTPSEPAPNIEVAMPQPIKTSTIYAVVGGAAVLVLGSVALWAWYKGKGKGK